MNTIIKNPITTVIPAKKELERQLIKSMAGSYKVSFKFAETFSPIKNYKYAERHFSQARELAIIIEDSENKIVIQHLLFVGKTVIKHWRQDWLYENREIFKLVKNHEWKKHTLTEEEAQGTWTQKVFQVDDSPRYEGYGTWVHLNNRHYWESTADAALPRREISTAGRTDYNVLRRHSRIEIFEDGSWLLEQDNEKIMRSEGNTTDTLICMEKGLERFVPVSYDISKTMDWWNERKAFWEDVRLVWNKIVTTQNYIEIREYEKLYRRQFDLAERFKGENYEREKAITTITNLLAHHVKDFN